MKKMLLRIYLLLTLLLAITTIEGFATPQYIQVSGITNPAAANGIYTKAGTFRADLTGYASTGIYYDYWTYTNGGTTYSLYLHQYNASGYYWNIDNDMVDSEVLFYNSDNGGSGYTVNAANAPIGAPVSPDLVSGWEYTYGTGVGNPIVTIPASSPTVTTTAASSISSTSATLGGNVTADGGATVTGRGVAYSTSDNTPTIAEGATQVTIGSGTGSFGQSVSSLTPGTTYYFNAYATNSAGTSYGTATSFITLTANNAPTNIALSASAINENVAANSTVGTLSSTDPDAINTFAYSLEAGAGGTDNASFTISGDKLNINISPNFEVKSSYSVRVRATDQGSLFFEKVFTITINDVNEIPTNIALSASAINENVAANSTVGTLSSTDPDAINTFTYSLEAGAGGTDNALFTISSDKLNINVIPNFEVKSSYSIRVRTTDQGPLFFEKAFTITINNVNEAPTNIALSASAINENVAANSTVGTLSSTDPDAINTFTYSLEAGAGSSDNASFTITGNSLSINASPDCEVKNSYSVRIRTTDQSSLSYDETFTITINDLNDVVPIIATAQVFHVTEQSPNGTTVGKVIATDGDITTTSFQNWTITAGNSSGCFAVNSSTGIITVVDNTGLNPSINQSFTLTLTVSDGTNTSSSQTVSIIVAAVNDDNPVITSSQSFAIDENSANNTVVGTVLATDPDYGTVFQNWAITAGNTSNAFAINPTTGVLTVNNSSVLDYETVTSFSLTIQVSDGVHTGTGTIIINLNDVLDTGIDDNKGFSLMVYPNPAVDKVNIHLNSSDPYSIEIFNIVGNKVYQSEINTPTETKIIDLTELTGGIYFVKVYNKQFTYTKKLVVK